MVLISNASILQYFHDGNNRRAIENSPLATEISIWKALGFLSVGILRTLLRTLEEASNDKKRNDGHDAIIHYSHK